jgi:cytochrome c-type biogenesis protein CcmH
MNGFVIAAAVMCVLVLWLVLRPLLSRREAAAAPQADQLNLAVLRDQLRELEADREQGSIDAEAYTAARRELEQRVAEDVHPGASRRHRASAGAASAPPLAGKPPLALVVAGAGVLYATLGTPQALVAPGAAPAAAAGGQALDPHTSSEAESMVAKLAERMAREPNDPNGWALLARSYSAMGRFVAASGAYSRLIALIPDDAQILSDYADVLAMTQNQKLRGEPERLLARALAADPKNVKALILSGDAAFERTDLASAAVHWQAALANAAPGSEFAQMARDNLAHIGALWKALPPGRRAAAPTPTRAAAPMAAAAPSPARVGRHRRQRPRRTRSCPARASGRHRHRLHRRQSRRRPALPARRAAQTSARPAAAIHAGRHHGHDARREIVPIPAAGGHRPHLQNRQRDRRAGRFGIGSTARQTGRHENSVAYTPQIASANFPCRLVVDCRHIVDYLQ